MKPIFVCVAAFALAGSAWGKLPAPSDEAKAKAAEAAAKTAHGGKVEAFLLCKAQDKVAARTNKAAKPAAKDAKAGAAPASACVDPGAFVYTPAAPAAAASSAAPAPAPAAIADKTKK
ncbi:MAG TPA: hypothetical protein PKH72_13900 [Rhodoferax sp.]|jgi:hypothetical protein|nr:hypothetical protein [Rhodoferax sp.]